MIRRSLSEYEWFFKNWSNEKWLEFSGLKKELREQNMEMYQGALSAPEAMICEICGKPCEKVNEKYKAIPIGCGCCGWKTCPECYDKLIFKIENEIGNLPQKRITQWL